MEGTGGGHDWQSWAVEIIKWALAGIAALGSSAAVYLGRSYRVDRKRLREAHDYVLALKKRRAAGRIVSYRKELRELKRLYQKTLKDNEQLKDLLRINNTEIGTYRAACTNLTTLVDLRGKEHHELRDKMQEYLNRLTIAETTLGIRHDWKHDA